MRIVCAVLFVALAGCAPLTPDKAGTMSNQTLCNITSNSVNSTANMATAENELRFRHADCRPYYQQQINEIMANRPVPYQPVLPGYLAPTQQQGPSAYLVNSQQGTSITGQPGYRCTYQLGNNRTDVFRPDFCPASMNFR